MKHVCSLILLLLGLWAAAPAYSETPRESFDRANRLYRDGKYEDALKAYREVEASLKHWKLFYNLGNCHFKLNDPLWAKIYYLRADRMQPFEDSIKKNLDIVDRMFKDKIPPQKTDFIVLLIKKIESFLTLDFVSLLLLICILGLNVFLFILVYKGRKKIVIYGLAFSLALTALFSFYHLYRVEKQKTRNTAVITARDSELRSGPGENHTILFKVNPGLEVKIIDRSGNWYRVSASPRIAGWIEVEDLEII